jgi:hypothetical protein
MGFGMRQIEGTAQRVAKLVMQRHANLPQHRAAEPGAVERFAPGSEILRIVDHPGQRAAKALSPSMASMVDIGLRF